MQTKIILTDDIRNLGHRGDVVSVKPGFARNYLFPKALAYPASEGNLKRLGQEKKQYDTRLLKEKDQAETISKAVEGMTIVLKKKAGDHDALYGSVTSSELADALAAKGVKVDKRRIELEEPIKRLGKHTVHVKLHRDVTVALTVDVQNQ